MNELAGVYFYRNEDREFEKYMVGGIFNNPNQHLTLRLWHDKRELDLHLTNESLPKGHPDRYYTIFRISYDNLEQLGLELQNLDFKSLLPEFLTMNLGKLNKTNCYLQLMTGDLTDLKQKMFKLKGSRKNKGRFSDEFPIDEIRKQMYMPGQLKRTEEGAFLIWRVKKGKALMHGYAYRYAIHMGTSKFIFISKKAMNKFQRKAIFLLYDKLRLIEFDNKDYVMTEFEKVLKRQFPLDTRFQLRHDRSMNPA
jgi:hypothetical protein